MNQYDEFVKAVEELANDYQLENWELLMKYGLKLKFDFQEYFHGSNTDVTFPDD